MRSKEKKILSLRSFQLCVACHLHVRKLGQFSTFNGKKSNCQFDSRPFFGHNLRFKCPNGSCEPILDIYVSISFQWYKKIFNPMGFDPCNCSLKIWESIMTPTPKMGVHLGVWRFIPSHFLALLIAWIVTPKLPSWPMPLQALALVVSPRLRLWYSYRCK
jgi:hypothetical protein